MRLRVLLCSLLLVVLIPAVLWGQRATDKAALLNLADQIRSAREKGQAQAYLDLLNSSQPAARALNDDPNIQLMYIRPDGKPMYYRTVNLIAAQTVSTDEVWPGGSTGYNLTGAGTTHSQFAVWDAGGVLLTHVEFGGRVIQVDGAATTHYHSTHVAGTMAAGGVDPLAKGMSYQANLSAYEWTNDFAEMATAAANGLQVSNHSYGYGTGWESYSGTWYWFGDVFVSTTEDYGFGYYDWEVADLDNICYNAPNYLICMSAGNDRNDYGPGPGGGHYYWDGSDWVWSTATRDADGGPSGYDCIGWNANAKNILTVGAVNDIPGGYTQPSDVVQSSFSSWGPCDDGRIKPDIVANGVGLYSCVDTDNYSYASFSGTSMSSPNAAGSVNLLARHFENVKGTTPRSATLKAVVVHTADEAGPNDGPDYMNGWGLLNTASAADAIALGNKVIEDDLTQGDTDVYFFSTTSTEDVRATLVWTDLPGTPPSVVMVDPTDPMLVNDLDLRVFKLDTYTENFPWVLDRNNPANAATRADNTADNVEQVVIDSAPAGDYMVVVSHKGILAGAPQEYSLVCSSDLGPGSAVACPPDDFVPAGSTIVPSMVLSGFVITNTGDTPATATYYLTPTGPCTLVDNGDPASLGGTTPTLLPGQSFTPPEAALVFPEIRTPSIQTVEYNVDIAGHGVFSCLTTITIESPVPVAVTAFAATPSRGGVELAWDVAADEEIRGFRVYRRTEGESVEQLVNAGGLIAATERGYTDRGITAGRSYEYTLAVVLGDDSEMRSRTVSVKTAADALVLEQNHPNPFNPSTRIGFTLDQDEDVTLAIYDVSGRLVRTLVSGVRGVGAHSEVWDGRDDFGQPAAGGIYFYRLTAGKRTLTKKMVLLK